MIQKGIYEHYKGNNYEVIGVALHSETEEPMVIYKALYESKFGVDTLWVRPLGMFKENVTIEGKKLPRFKLIEEKKGK